MENEVNCPVCYATITLEDGAGYCILCEEVVYLDEDGKLNNDLLKWIEN